MGIPNDMNYIALGIQNDIFYFCNGRYPMLLYIGPSGCDKTPSPLPEGLFKIA